MKKSDLWIAAAASLGVGAATFYAMSKSDQPLNTAMESVTPLLSKITGSTSNIGKATNPQGNHATHQTDHQSTQTLGPFGMS